MSDSAAAIPRPKPAKLPPGPRGAFLLGHIAELIRDSMRFLESCTREYGDVVRLKFFHVPVCLLANPADIELVLSKNSANFLKARDYRAMKSILNARFPGVDVAGFFIARRVFPNPFEDFPL